MLARMITKVFSELTTSVECSLDHKLKTLDRIQFNYTELGEEKIKTIPEIVDKTKIQLLEALNIELPKILPLDVVGK